MTYDITALKDLATRLESSTGHCEEIGELSARMWALFIGGEGCYAAHCPPLDTWCVFSGGSLVADRTRAPGFDVCGSIDSSVALCERVLPGGWRRVFESAVGKWMLDPRTTTADLPRFLCIELVRTLIAWGQAQ